MNNAVETREGNLILDSHKLAYHFDRVEQWDNGEQIAPVSVDMSLTRACGAMCSFCYAMVQEPQERAAIKTKDALNLLDDFAEVGVKAVSLISDGESTLSKAYVPFIQHAAKAGIDVGNATNGWEWEPDKIDQVLPHLTWVRFTVGAGKAESYAKIMFLRIGHKFNKQEEDFTFGLFEEFGSTDPALTSYDIPSPYITDNEKVYGTRFHDVIEGGNSDQEFYLLGGNDTVNAGDGIE